ncbi:hypothetical protein VP1G_05369 [Cytospora mali]|uniref:Uncharacterized protein n=1 Tax=Cytospora mali TaxID=578113 RepID=A0A194V2F5_CYTMA|nr:hypothetical protein VP1G_05369 [Valsa mali var. pyri (nom. inval.)]
MSEITPWEGAATTVEYEVQIGTWINWSRGRIMGATLTLNRTDGNLLIAFTAFFVGLVSSRFWRIACFIAHRLYSTPEPRDALHHQKLAILCNSASAGTGLWTFLQLAWTWCGTAKRCFVRTLPSVLTSAFCLAAFTTAGGFSSQISSGMGNEVLIKGDNCAIVSFQADDVADTINISSSWTSNKVNNAANYAQQCYSTISSGMFDCSPFVKANLPSTVDKKADCPFKESIYRSNDSNLLLNTGYINTNKHLGINFPSGQNILFRSVAQCVPLVTEGYKWNASETWKNFTRYNYGPFYRTPTYT